MARKEDRKAQVKKWKGKDWFSIFVPDWIGGTKVAETPSTDPKSVMGRVVETSVAELMGDQSKYYMKLCFRINAVDGNRCNTIFQEFVCINEFVMRMSRKGLDKVVSVSDAETKDGWKLQLNMVLILNRRTDLNIRKVIRNIAEETLSEKSSNLNHDEFIKAIIAGVFQRKIKKLCSKIYPVRFCEVIKIETIKPGA